jgi:hypothetical protein
LSAALKEALNSFFFWAAATAVLFLIRCFRANPGTIGSFLWDTDERG